MRRQMSRTAAIALGLVFSTLAVASSDDLAVVGCIYNLTDFQADKSEEREALLDDDLDAARAAGERIAAGVLCLNEVVNYADWADHLVSVAVLRYSTNANWQTPLAAALRAHPVVDRVVGGQHPISSWHAGVEPAGSVRVDPGIEVHVDGRLVSYLPRLGGENLVQVRRDGRLSSRLYGDEVNPEWLQSLAAPSITATAPTTLNTALPPARARMRTAGVGLAIGGGVLAAAGVTTGLVSAAQAGWDPDQASQSQVTTNVVGYTVGAVGLGAATVGVVLFAISPKKGSVSVIPTRGGILASGRF